MKKPKVKNQKSAKKTKKIKKIVTRKPAPKKTLKLKPKPKKTLKAKTRKPAPKAKKVTAKKPLRAKQIKKTVKVKPKKFAPKLKAKKVKALKPKIKKALPLKKKITVKPKKITTLKVKPVKTTAAPKMKIISVKFQKPAPKKASAIKPAIKLPPKKPLKADQIQYFKNILLKKKTDCENRLAKLEERMKHTQQEDSGDASTYPLHIGDIASDTEVKEQSSYMISSIVKELRRINNALERLDSGNYGHCENCGHIIDINRLNTIPYAEFCIKCGEEHQQGF